MVRVWIREVTTVKPSLLELFEGSGDREIGQMIVRLAGLAEAAHRVAVAEGLASECVREGQVWVGGVNPESGSLAACREAGVVYKEVDR
jgi:hypothetical protein